MKHVRKKALLGVVLGGMVLGTMFSASAAEIGNSAGFNFTFYVNEGTRAVWSGAAKQKPILSDYAIATVSNYGGDYNAIKVSVWNCVSNTMPAPSTQVTADRTLSKGQNKVPYYGTMKIATRMLRGQGSYIEGMLAGTWTP